MKRCLVLPSVFLVCLAACAADEPVKVAIDPAKAGADYKIQGEYQAKAPGINSAPRTIAAQVVARGDGKFAVYILEGGLPGDGWDGKAKREAAAKTEDGKVAFTGKDFSGTIADGVLTLKEEKLTVQLKRVERKSKTEGEKPPQGAVVLFDGKESDEWPKSAKLVDGHLVGGDFTNKKGFKDHKAHLEFRLSYMPFATGQGRSNSGVYVQNRYEVQVLDSFGLKGENNECGGVYSQAKPLVNMCYPPLTWQTYDIDFKAARFDPDGKKTANAVLSVWHNGVLIHDKVELKGPTGGGQPETDKPGPFQLQGHGGQVQYRNIWVVEKDEK